MENKNYWITGGKLKIYLYKLKIYLIDCKPEFVEMYLDNETLEEAIYHSNALFNANAMIHKIELYTIREGIITLIYIVSNPESWSKH